MNTRANYHATHRARASAVVADSGISRETDDCPVRVRKAREAHSQRTVYVQSTLQSTLETLRKTTVYIKINKKVLKTNPFY